MNASDHELVSSLRSSLLSLAGHAHRAEFDAASATAVTTASKSLARALFLLGSGLLAVDAPISLPAVSSVVIELTESDAANRHFEWHLVSPEHLIGCAGHFLRTSLSANSDARTSALHTAATLLDHVSGAPLPDADAVNLLYLSRSAEFVGDIVLSARLDTLAVALLEVAHVSAAVHAVWHRGLFALIRSRLLASVDATSTAASTSARAADGVLVAELFGELRWHTGALSREDTPTLFALALPACGALSAPHRLSGLRLVARFVYTADSAAMDMHFDAVLEAARESLTLAHAAVLPMALDVLLAAVRIARDSDESLSRPDQRCEAAAALAFDAVARFAEEEARAEEGGEEMREAAARAMRTAVQIADIALLRRASLFAALFATLFVRAARTVDGDIVCMTVLADAFKIAVDTAWPRIGAARVVVVRACVTSIMESRRANAAKRLAVRNAARDTLSLLMQCDGARRTRVLLEGLLEQAVLYPSLKEAAVLLSDALKETRGFQAGRRKWDEETVERYGELVHRFFPDGVETPVYD